MSLKLAIGKEFELYDINEDVTGANIRHKVADNVEFVLRREKLLPRGYSVIIPIGGDDYGGGDQEELQYSGNFEIFASGHNTIVAYGHVYGYGLGDILNGIDVTVTEVTGVTLKSKPSKRTKFAQKACVQSNYASRDKEVSSYVMVYSLP